MEVKRGNKRFLKKEEKKNDGREESGMILLVVN